MQNFSFENYRQSQWAAYYLRLNKQQNIFLSPSTELPIPAKKRKTISIFPQKGQLLHVFDYQSNIFSLNYALYCLNTLPQDEQDKFNYHLSKIFTLKDRLQNSPAINTIIDYHINEGSSCKTINKKQRQY